MWRITVNEEPVPKARPRFGNGRVFTPRTTELAESRIRAAWLNHYPGIMAPAAPLALTVEVHVRRPASHYGTGRNAGTLRAGAPARPMTRPDLDNYAKTVCDALKGVAWGDDGQLADIRLCKLYTLANPRWEIQVDTCG